MVDSTSETFGPTPIVSTYEGGELTTIRISADLNKLPNGQQVFYTLALMDDECIGAVAVTN